MFFLFITHEKNATVELIDWKWPIFITIDLDYILII